MGRLIALVLMVGLVMGAGPSHAADEWVEAAAIAARSTTSVQEMVTDEAGIQSVQTVCTAWSIDEQRGMLVTAFHCIGDGMRVNWQIAWVVYANPTLDLAVLQSPGVRLPALKPRTRPILAGLSIAGFGHAYGWEVPLFRAGHVSHPYMLVPPVKDAYPTLDGRFLVTDFAPIGGMSGGPMLDVEGKVVSITQMGNGVQGLGQPIDVILRATAGFWEGQ